MLVNAQTNRKYEMELFDSLPKPVREVFANSPIGIKTSTVMIQQGGLQEMRRIGPVPFASLLKHLLEKQSAANSRKRRLLTA